MFEPRWATRHSEASRRGRTIHVAKNVGGVTATEFATYVVEKGKPLVTLVK
jgi:hypothetical protein